MLEWALIALLIFRGGEGSWLLGLAAATLLVLPLLICATLAVLTKPRDMERYALML